MRAAVVVTLLNDPRVVRTLRSLDRQERPPDTVLVADGGSTDGSLAAIEALGPSFALRVEHLPGSVAETRAAAVPRLDADVLVFLDADEVAPPAWLACLLGPIEAGEADVVGGPTRPYAPARSRAEAYINDFEAWFYDHVVARDATMLPMGNSAWRRRVFDEAGNFDARLRFGGEDYDMNLRAAQAGFRLRYEPGAWVYHDQSHLDAFRKVMRRKYRYGKGATMAYLKNGVLGRKAPGAMGTAARFRHRYEVCGAFLKPVALAAGWAAWRRVRDEPARSPQDDARRGGPGRGGPGGGPGEGGPTPS